MKVLAVFAAVVAVACGLSPISTWTLTDLMETIRDPNTDPAVLPYLEIAMDDFLQNWHLHGGDGDQASITVSVPTESAWTLEELSAAIQDPNTSPALLSFYEAAHHQMVVALINGQEMETINVAIPAMAVHMWTLDELSEAIQNPETDPELLVHLEHALNQMMNAIAAGEPMLAIAVVTPPGVVVAAPAPIPVENPGLPIVVPGPIAPPDVIIDPPMPVLVPEPVAHISSPLVKIIVNVNQQ